MDGAPLADQTAPTVTQAQPRSTIRRSAGSGYTHRFRLTARFRVCGSVAGGTAGRLIVQLSKERAMSSTLPLLDAAGRRRSPATTPGFRNGIAPRNKGQRYPADPPTVDEIVAVMRQAGHDRHGHRLSALIVVLWRAGLRIHEALSLTETDLDQRRGSILVRHGKNDRRREVGMDAWAWSAIEPWLADRLHLAVGPLFCVIDGPTRGRAWSDSADGSSFATSRSKQASGVDSRPTSFATPTPSSSCTRGSHCR